MFRVEDIEKARDELTKCGVRLGHVRSPAPGISVCDGTDPSGNPFSIELCGVVHCAVAVLFCDKAGQHRLAEFGSEVFLGINRPTVLMALAADVFFRYPPVPNGVYLL